MEDWMELAPENIARAKQEGLLRQKNNIEAGRRNTKGLGIRDNPRDLAYDINGLAAELALGQALGIEVVRDVSGPTHQPDVGPHDVRSTTRNDGGMLLYRNDVDDRFCFLVITNLPRFRIAGYLRIGDGKQDKWWGSPKLRPGSNAWLIPQTELIPFELKQWRKD
jgi:hypothetical protein